MQLRPYQTDLVQQVRQAWRQGFKAPCIVLPCGGGKSCIVAEMARQTTLNGKRVLFLVHRKELCEQIEKTFALWGVNMDLCRVMMVQTATRRLAKLDKPALIITDENHHSLARTYRRIYDYFPDVYRVGVTATPIRLNGGGLGDVNDKLIVGVSAKWLIENKCLSPYDYFSPSITDLTGLKTRSGEYVAGDVEQRLKKPKICGSVISYYFKLASGKKAICYCVTVAHSQEMADAFCSAGIPAAHIDANTPPTERAAIVNAFRCGDIRILCNVDLISEGFDVPDCECSILLRPTKSLTLYIQQSMRCMRYRPNKRAIIIDHVGNYARFGLPDQDRKWSLDTKKTPEGFLTKQCAKCCDTFEIPPKEDITVCKDQCKDCPSFIQMAIGNASSRCPKKPAAKIKCPVLNGKIVTICPHCGHIMWSDEEYKPKQIEHESGELVKVTGFKLILKTPDDCQTYQDLLEYAKSKGYKPGWAYYQAKKRGLIA
jgi:superfamily II DNA or RNA helicase